MIRFIRNLIDRKADEIEGRVSAEVPVRQHRSIIQTFADLRADYRAAKSNRFTRQRLGLPALGSGADYHYRNEIEYFRMLERARDMDRNDAIVPATVDRAVINTIQGGFSLDPRTGDDGLNAELKERWVEWSETPDLCDLAGELCFSEMESLILRHVFVDGDICVLPNIEGPLELIESQRLRTPARAQRQTVLGVEMDSNRKRLRYWFTKQDINPNAPSPNLAAMTPVAVRTGGGDGSTVRQLFHVYHPKRVSQTRGVTAFAPIFELLGMLEDLQFAKLMQAQIVSCFAVFRSRDINFKSSRGANKLGKRTAEATTGSFERTIEDIVPGMVLSGEPGETLSGSSPAVPNPEFFPHVKMIMQLVGINLGLPLVLVLMDASETNFSGWRGAVDQAKMGFRHNQRFMIARFHRPVYRWKLDQWVSEDGALRRQRNILGGNFYRNRWHTPTWPYVEPMKDAKADALRRNEHLISASRQMAERGFDWDDVSVEIAHDNGQLIAHAMEVAAELNKAVADGGERITWRDVLGAAGGSPGGPPETDAEPQPAEAVTV